MRMRYLFTLFVLFAVPLSAQGPSADWRTVTTPHFRVHYTAPAEAWARRAAERLESIRERVVAEVGYEPPEVVDVLVSDPVADANGMALPFLGWPRMVLWTSPPGPDSVIGHYSDWSELLIVHEETHLVHLLRPPRNPLRRLLTGLLPLSTITVQSPRWVTEGYATVVEGRLTGSGRPNGDLRAAILRRWAQGGKLPGYGALAADSRTWRGQSMAYLVGSAYLEWLEERQGPGSLRKLWARMTARTARSFDDAFRGVFGDSPANLYDRFRAELTWRAIEAERRVGPEQGEGELWQDLSWDTGDPALSPDGKLLVLALRSRDRPARLAIWSTEPDEEAERKWRERRDEIAKEDPEDVPAERTRPLPRKVLYSLAGADGPEPTMPRFLPDGKSVLFVRWEPDSEGFLHPDLFVWTYETGRVRRVTHDADLRDPDPAPDGRWAVAIRNRHGLSQIVRVDLANGEVSAVTEPSVEEVYDRPRVSPDGRRIAYAWHGEGSWRLVLQDLDGNASTELAPPQGATVSAPAWSSDGRTVYAVVGQGGFLDVHAFPADDPAGGPVPLTRSQGAALAPVPAPDGSALFFLAMEPDGLDLRRLALPARAAARPPDLPAGLAPAVRPPEPGPAEPFVRAEVAASRPYRWGRQELFPLLGGSASSSGGVLELGLRGGDVVGRLDWLVLGSVGEGEWPEGGAVAAGWRGWPVEVGAHLFQSSERPSEEGGAGPAGLDLDRRGIELSTLRDWQWSGGALSLAARGLWNEIEADGTPEVLDQRVFSLAGAWGGGRRLGPHAVIRPGLSGHFETGDTEGSGWSRFGGTARLGVAYKDTGLVLNWRRDSSRDVDRSFDRFQLGGPRLSLLPETALANRIAVPGLPVGTLTGTEHEGERAELTFGFLPAPLFYERHRLWDEGQSRVGWLSLAGLEYRLDLDPLPIGRLPGLDLRVGVARVLEAPLGDLEDDVRWWLITVWRP